LKETGSIFLHCDPTASHYLKLVMDIIFGPSNFLNEIVWCYSQGGRSKKWFGRKHDIIFWYSKTNTYTFNYQDITLKYTPHKQDASGKNYGGRMGVDEEGREYVEKWGTGKKKLYRYYLDEGKIPEDYWTDINSIQSGASERLGYPTQKPEELLERIIKAASTKGGWVLDPFCGCGTTISVSEKLERNWIGIDISMQAVNVIKERMTSHFPTKEVIVDGIPMDFESAQALAEKDKFAFQDWAITLVGANPPGGETKRGPDRGIDGIILFRDKVDYANPKLRKILIQVKGGGVNRGDIAKLKGDIEREDAPMGILITLREPTSEMKREAALAGEYKYTESTTFPKIQILSIKDWFDGKEVKIPSDKINPFKNAKAKSDQPSLLD